MAASVWLLPWLVRGGGGEDEGVVKKTRSVVKILGGWGRQPKDSDYLLVCNRETGRKYQ